MREAALNWRWRLAVAWLACGAIAALSELKAADPQAVQEFVTAHCLSCHSGENPTAQLALDRVLHEDVAAQVRVWEAVVRRLAGRQMPPQGEPRPSEEQYEQVVGWLEERLDHAWRANPDVGRTESLRRLTRVEYQNAIRDLLHLDINAAELLPPDESSQGFDNITVTDLSPALLGRYIAAAQKISRAAVGRAGTTPDGATFRLRPDVTQDVHLEGLPLGTRGGGLFAYHFPQDGEYEIQVRLMRDRNENVEGLKGPHELDVLLDRERVAQFKVAPQRGQGDAALDAGFNVRLKVTAGPHEVGATFVQRPFSLLETNRQPLNVHYNFYRHPRLGPAVYQVSILGPFDPAGPGMTPSRERIFTCRPASPDEEAACATRILTDLVRRAYRRPVRELDLETPLEFFRAARETGDFDAGIEQALAAVLVSPQFLFRIEQDPTIPMPDRTFYRVSDIELASRLSFFLWSSIPDDELLAVAERGELSQRDVLEAQVRRMLADERAQALVTNFADQWLHLRNLDAFIPDARLYPDFDDNLRQAFRRETELLFESVLHDDRSVLALIDPGYTFLNERLARHYGIPHVQGSRFRRVELDDASQRGGLLRHGSVLAVTSYATRTSPVIRGKWILENLLGCPPPPPPANVPALEDNTVSAALPVRERLAAHRAHEACASCHDLIDPVGFALEHFDAVGRWRDLEEGRPVDASGGTPDGRTFNGIEGLEQALLARPDLFARTLTEKLLTYALGRGVGYTDAPSIRQIVHEARDDNYRFSSLILGIARSPLFQMRRLP